MSSPVTTGGRLRIRVAVERCVGHARCATVVPEVYELDENGYNRTAEKIVNAELRESALRGKRACPERVITVEEIADHGASAVR